MVDELEGVQAIDEVFEDRAVRRQGGREMPLGPKAQRTRAHILGVAAEVFSAQGYLGTTMPDVAKAANVSLGTVYQYFLDRSDLVAALLRGNTTARLRRSDPTWRADEGYPGLYCVVLNFVDAYVEARSLAGVWEEACHVEEELAALRRALGRRFTGAVEEEIRRTITQGLVRTDVDSAMTARALTGMVDRYCYVTYVFDPPAEGIPTPEQSAAVLTKLWLGALGLALAETKAPVKFNVASPAASQPGSLE